jgi:hypothetical protein
MIPITWAVDLMAWWLLRIARKAMAASEARIWYYEHGFGYEQAVATREYERLHRSYRKWLPLYTELREIENGDH